MPQRCYTNINGIWIERVDGLYNSKQEKKFIALEVNFDMVIYKRTLYTPDFKTNGRHGNKYHQFCKSEKRKKYDLKIVFINVSKSD